MSANNKVPHPGARIKSEVIPSDISVTKAAQLMGVGRPALSNLLNGNASLSPEMAARIERTFNYPRKDLLEMQAQYDAAQAKLTTTPAEAKAYVPPFLGIKANQIEEWANGNISARTRLSVLLRTLVHSTGTRLTKVNFPGNDDGERAGWDGVTEAGEGTPWIPLGRSGWEFGVDKNIKKKADHDFEKSIKPHDHKETIEITFIFVTPRRWPGKEAWIKTAKSKGYWKDVRAYDSSDLEQWIEQSIPAQAWFADETSIPAHGVRSLDKCWADWANVADPPLTGTLFSSAIEAAKRSVISRLSKLPNGPIIIAADSTEEALAFVSQLFGGTEDDDLSAHRDRVLVFDQPGVLPRLAQGAQAFIPVVYTREVERELALNSNSMHSIIIYPRNATSTQSDLVLEPSSHESFTKALEEMGKERDEIRRLENESGRSLTVLRRRLATINAVRTPFWAEDHMKARSLVPFLFVGAWQSTNDADCLGLSLLADERPYNELEIEFQSLVQLNDAPVWSIGNHRGIVSKIDLLHAISGVITRDDLNSFFSVARTVLGEDDPALDLDEDKRWAASIYGKTREFSAIFRKGISETLVLLATNGGPLFKQRLGFDTEMEAAKIVRELMPMPLTTRILEANDHDLPTYAEAAPEEFLSIIERDLRSETPATLGLLRPATVGILGHPSRTGLLWALEGLAWNPQTLPRTAIILARLSQVKIDDNWANKPMSSLQKIFRSWMPQTAASHESRVNLMKCLAGQFPDVAWKLCVSQFGSHDTIGDYSHKPRWRSDGFGFGEPFPTRGPILKFQREMVEMALTWKDHNTETLTNLVERLDGLDDDYQAKVWKLIESWAKTKASDSDKAELREAIRISVLSQRAARRAKNRNSFATLTKNAKDAFAALEPRDLMNKHAWLFRETWIEESADEVGDIDEIDYEKRAERIHILRVNAMREILRQFGLTGLLELADRGRASSQIGSYAARDLLSEDQLLEFLRLALDNLREGKKAFRSSRSVIAGALHAIPEVDKRERILSATASHLLDDDLVQLLKIAPFDKCTWKLVDLNNEALRTRYWSDVLPVPIQHSVAENKEAIERLLKAKRPRAAFFCVRFHPENLDSQLLFRLLSAVAAGGNENPGEFMLDHYNVEKAFSHIDASSSLTLDQKAELELAFLDVLAPRWEKRGGAYGIPNLERYTEEHPEVFVQAIAWAYKREDDALDPEDFQVPQDQLQSIAKRGYTLIEAIQRIPGQDEVGDLRTKRLAQWIETVRQTTKELSRAGIADFCIGKLLSNAPIGEDGVWPCEAVRKVMEDIQSESMMEGAANAVYNSRGVVRRLEGGDQERELERKYRNWGDKLQISHPYVSSKLLMELARTYELQASREDTEAGIRRRLR